MPDNRLVTALFAASCVGKTIILVLESTEKRSLLKRQFKCGSLESTASTFNRGLFWWLNGLLWKGSKTTLTVDSLPELDEAIKTASNPEALVESWNNGTFFPIPKPLPSAPILTSTSSRQVSTQRIALDRGVAVQMGDHGGCFTPVGIHRFQLCSAVLGGASAKFHDGA
jgi:hypothetical protein